jgi:hypothetical protein
VLPHPYSYDRERRASLYRKVKEGVPKVSAEMIRSTRYRIIPRIIAISGGSFCLKILFGTPSCFDRKYSPLRPDGMILHPLCGKDYR